MCGQPDRALRHCTEGDADVECRRLGKTELQVSAIGYGGIKLPGISQEEADRCLNRALDLGINFVDTHRGYGDSETKIGNALEGRRDEYLLATKTHSRDRGGELADLRMSLAELRTDHVDLWQLHSVSNEETWQAITAQDGAVKALHAARSQGLALHVGITIHRSLDVMRKAIACGEFETVMLVYGPTDTESVADILPLARAQDMGTIAMKALSGGAMVYPMQARKAGFGGPDAMVAGALRWALSNENVNCVIPGMLAVHEVEENAAVGSPFSPLTDADRERLLRVIGEFGGTFRYSQRCLRCGYCQPCPQGVAVPDILHSALVVRRYPDALKHMGFDAYNNLEVGAEACQRCGECIEKCPAGLPIPEMIEEAAQLLRQQ